MHRIEDAHHGAAIAYSTHYFEFSFHQLTAQVRHESMVGGD
jgi:hypothetical protein